MEGAHGKCCYFFVFAAGCDDGHVAERREMHLLAQGQFCFAEAVCIMSAGKLNGCSLWVIGLDDNLTIQITASGMACNLGEQLECALGCSRVWNVQPKVCIQYPHEGNPRKVKSFGNHLCAQQNIEPVGAEICQNIA